MSVVMSFRDLLSVVPEFQGKTEIDLLHPKMDLTMRECLAQAGFDVNEPIDYVANNHRDLKGNIGVGFRAVGVIDPYNREFLNSRLADNFHRMSAAGRVGDYSLAYELSKLMCIGSPTRMMEDDGAGCVEPEDLTDIQRQWWVNDQFEMISAQMAALTDILYDIRQDAYDEYGKKKPLGWEHFESSNPVMVD